MKPRPRDPAHQDAGEALERPSRSAKKRAVEWLQTLGEQLSRLSRKQLEALPLSEELRDALLAAPTMQGRPAQRRHRQYIGRLMREVDQAQLEQAILRAGIRLPR